MSFMCMYVCLVLVEEFFFLSRFLIYIIVHLVGSVAWIG